MYLPLLLSWLQFTTLATAPRELQGMLGRDTITDADRKVVLPDKATLLGAFDWNRDGSRELFAGWSESLDRSQGLWENHVLVLRPDGNGRTRVVKEYRIRGTEMQALSFYAPPDARDKVKITVHLLGGATWSTVYLIEPGRERALELFAPNDYAFVDLDGDGVYEAVAWNRRPDDSRCRFGLFGVRVNPTIYVRSGDHFREVWPVKGVWRQVAGVLADTDGDGIAELIALEDNGANGPGAQRLAVHKMDEDGFRMLSETPVPWPSIGFLVDAADRGVMLWTATKSRCEAGGDPEGEGTERTLYGFRDGRLIKRRR
jgi:hypothetical protein